MNQETDCKICQEQAAWTKKERDRLVVCEDRSWIVRHSVETDIAGYLVVESKRHFLDLSEASPTELAGYGPLLADVVDAVRFVTDCQRVYTIALGEAVPHFHVHVIPRRASMPQEYRGRGILSYPVVPAVDETTMAEMVEQLRRAVAKVPIQT